MPLEWRPVNIEVLLIIVHTQLFVQILCQVNNKEILKDLHCWIPTIDGSFPAQKASKAESASMS